MTTTTHPKFLVNGKARGVQPGSTGWSASDLEDPQIEAEWFRGRFEMIEGVIAPMAAAYLDGGLALSRLTRIVEAHLSAIGDESEFCHEVDLVLSELRVVVPDVMLVTSDFLKSQAEAVRVARREDPHRTRILVAPKLLIESSSPGHERHDTVLKKQWYAEFGVRNYWIVDAFSRSLICYALKGTQYEVDCQGRDEEELRPSVFAPLTINLSQLWRSVPK